jgi:hypothetical protein
LIARVALDRDRRMSSQLSETIGRHQPLSGNQHRCLQNSVVCLGPRRQCCQTTGFSD